MMNYRLTDKTGLITEKKAILFDVDDTLYDQTIPFKEAYAQYFGNEPAIPAEVIYPVTRKYSDHGRTDHNGRTVYIQSEESV